MSAAPGLTDGLAEELQAARDEVDRFERDMTAALDGNVAAAEKLSAEFTERSAQLAKEEAEYIAKAVEVEADHREEDRQTAEARSELDALRMDRDKLPVEINTLKEEESKAKDEMAGVADEVERKEKDHKYAIDELTKGIALYKRIGLEFDGIGEDLLRMQFTQIDPKAPEREFMFAVAVTDDNVYAVAEVTPDVGDVSAVVEELNETNDFSFFVRTMRKRFKLFVAAESS